MWSPWLVMLVYSRLLSCKRLRKLGSSPSSSSCTSPLQTCSSQENGPGIRGLSSMSSALGTRR